MTGGHLARGLTLLTASRARRMISSNCYPSPTHKQAMRLPLDALLLTTLFDAHNLIGRDAVAET